MARSNWRQQQAEIKKQIAQRQKDSGYVLKRKGKTYKVEGRKMTEIRPPPPLKPMPGKPAKPVEMPMPSKQPKPRVMPEQPKPMGIDKRMSRVVKQPVMASRPVQKPISVPVAKPEPVRVEIPLSFDKKGQTFLNIGGKKYGVTQEAWLRGDLPPKAAAARKEELKKYYGDYPVPDMAPIKTTTTKAYPPIEKPIVLPKTKVATPFAATVNTPVATPPIGTLVQKQPVMGSKLPIADPIPASVVPSVEIGVTPPIRVPQPEYVSPNYDMLVTESAKRRQSDEQKLMPKIDTKPRFVTRPTIESEQTRIKKEANILLLQRQGQKDELFKQTANIAGELERQGMRDYIVKGVQSGKIPITSPEDQKAYEKHLVDWQKNQPNVQNWKGAVETGKYKLGLLDQEIKNIQTQRDKQIEEVGQTDIIATTAKKYIPFI